MVDPRLGQFHAHNSTITLHLMAAGGPVDFNKMGIELAIRREDFYWADSVYGFKLC